MRFKNISRKKENIEYCPGDVLNVYNETLFEEEVYMVISRGDMYNILNLNSGLAYFSDYENYDSFAEKLEKSLILIEIIDNNELELVRVED